MSIATSELQVAEGLANDFDLRALNYGILLHRRRADGTAVKEDFEYRALVDSNTNPLRLPGIGPDDDRIDFERGHGTSLDQRLVRRSAFRFAPSTATGQGVGSLQQLFLVVKPKKGASFQPALGLKWKGGPDLAPIVCPPEGLPALRIWCTEEWQDSSLIETEAYDGDVTEWAAKLGRTAESLVTAKAPIRGAETAEVFHKEDAPRALPPIEYDVAAPAPQVRIPRRESPLQTSTSAPEAVVPADSQGDKRVPKRGWRIGLVALGTIIVGYYLLIPAPQKPPSAPTRVDLAKSEPQRTSLTPNTRTSPQPVLPPKPAPDTTETLANSELARLAQSVMVPTGNSPAERQRLYDPRSGFDEQFALLNTLLDSALKGERASFDQQSALLKSSKAQTPPWPAENSVDRRKFNERLADLINTAVEANDAKYLERAVELSEQFLGSHFGHSTAHLNLSLGLSQLGRFAEAQGPAYHAIYYNPDGINGYFALGLALAGQSQSQRAAAAFCAALRKSRFSVKTVDFFNEVAAGRKYGRTPVASTMAAAIGQCPAHSWGADLPPQ